MQISLNSVDGENDQNEDDEDVSADVGGNVPNDECVKKSGRNEAIESGFSKISHHNYPVVCETYKNPGDQCDKVTAMIIMPGGTQNVSVNISEDDLSANIKYKWSKTMYDMEDVYSKMLAANTITLHHPRILAINTGLTKYRSRIDEAPESCIKIDFPIKVQTSAGSWSKFGVRRGDGTQIMVLDLTGFVKSYNTKISDSVVEFD